MSVNEFRAGVAALAKVLAVSKHELGWREAVVFGGVAPDQEGLVERWVKKGEKKGEKSFRLKMGEILNFFGRNFKGEISPIFSEKKSRKSLVENQIVSEISSNLVKTKFWVKFWYSFLIGQLKSDSSLLNWKRRQKGEKNG